MKFGNKVICYISFFIASFIFYCLVAFGTLNLARLIITEESLVGLLGIMAAFIICYPVCMILFYELKDRMGKNKK